MAASGSPEEKRPRRRFFLSRLRFFRRLRKRYYVLRRRKLRAHYEKFRHMTVRSTSPFYRFLLLFRRSFHYVRTLISSVTSFLSPLFFPLMAVLMIGGCFWFFSNYSVGLAVSVDGEVIGYVENSAEYDRINNLVETRVKNESVAQTGEELYLVEAFPTLQYAVIPKDRFTSEEALFSSLYTMASDYTRRSYGLFLDGVLVAADKDRAELDRLIDEVMKAYVTGNGDALEIINRLEIIRGEYDTSYNMGFARMLDLFTSGPNLKTYTVQKEDTLESISQRSGISVPVLRLLNDIPVGQQVSAGQILFYGKPYCQLTVKNTLTLTETETEAFETEYVYSKDYWEGTRIVLQNGSNGVYELVYNNVYVNGQASSVSLVSRTKIKDSVPKRILVGTKPIAPSGKFIFPLSSYQFVSSEFGWRWLYGSRNFHRGLDIAAVRGTPIYAADAGTVVEAGWDRSLGWYVRIDHGNGIQTVYGHCSSLAVSAGEKAHQGKVIAYVGSTGNSTGNHLHFAVYNKSSGEYMNPRNYIRLP